MKVQQELDETKVVLHKTIESVLQRGEKLDQLVERSDALSAQSRLFYKTAKKQVSNSPTPLTSFLISLEFVLSGYVG
jgi:synaptobrevin homolog YKT6